MFHSSLFSPLFSFVQFQAPDDKEGFVVYERNILDGPDVSLLTFDDDSRFSDDDSGKFVSLWDDKDDKQDYRRCQDIKCRTSELPRKYPTGVRCETPKQSPTRSKPGTPETAYSTESEHSLESNIHDTEARADVNIGESSFRWPSQCDDFSVWESIKLLFGESSS